MRKQGDKHKPKDKMVINNETNMLFADTNTNEDNLQQHASSIRQLKTNYPLMK